MIRRLTQEETWIARLFRAACADEKALDRLAGRSGPHTSIGSRLSSVDVEQRTEPMTHQEPEEDLSSLERDRLAIRT